MYQIRQLGYAFDGGIIELSKSGVEICKIAIFSTHGISTHIFISETEVVFFSSSGQVANLDCNTGQITKRSQLPEGIRAGKVLYNIERAEIIFITGGALYLICPYQLTVKFGFDFAQRMPEGHYKLVKFSDLQSKFKELSDKDREERIGLIKAATARGEAPDLPDYKWFQKDKKQTWSNNGEDYCNLSFAPNHAVQTKNGTIILSYLYHVQGLRKKISGIAKISHEKQTVSFYDLPDQYPGKDDYTQTNVLAISPDGSYFITDHSEFHTTLNDSSKLVPKKRRLFDRSAPQLIKKLPLALEVWDIRDVPKFNKLISTGSADYENLFPNRVHTHWHLPNDWYDDEKRSHLNGAVVAAFKPQIKSIVERLTWSENDFGNAIVKEMKRRRLDMTDILNKGRCQEKGLKFSSVIVNRLVYCELVNYISHHSPDFFLKHYDSALSEEQQNVLDRIWSVARFHGHQNLVVTISEDSKLVYAFQRSNHLVTINIDSGEKAVCSLENIPKADINHSWKQRSHTITLKPQAKDTLRLEYSYGCVDIAVSPIEVTPRAQIVKLIYDYDRFRGEHKLAEIMARKIRQGYIEIRSKSSKNIIEGIQKLTIELRNHHTEIILSNRWDAGLGCKGAQIDEFTWAKVLIEENAIDALPTLHSFVQTVMDVQSPETLSNPSWQVFHFDDQANVGAPAITCIIRLSKSVTHQILEFARHRDYEHENYFHDLALPEDILPYLDIRTPGLLNLVAITSLHYLATGRVENELFASRAMDFVKDGILSHKLTCKEVAQIFIAEAKAIESNIGWASKNGPHGLIAQVVYGLDRSQSWQENLAIELLSQYPKAKKFLENLT